MCNLSGKNFDQIKTIENTLQKAFSENIGWSEQLISEFFTINYYKKGTVHLKFIDLSLLDLFNSIAAKGKNWLPGDR